MNTTRSNEFYENLIKQVFLLEATVNTLTFFIKKYNPELAKELDNPLKKFKNLQIQIIKILLNLQKNS